MDFREKIQTFLKSDKNVGYFKLIPKYDSVVESSTKYFVAQKQCKRNPPLGLHDHT
jgi:hypothetical protein